MQINNCQQMSIARTFDRMQSIARMADLIRPKIYYLQTPCLETLCGLSITYLLFEISNETAQFNTQLQLIRSVGDYVAQSVLHIYIFCLATIAWTKSRYGLIYRMCNQQWTVRSHMTQDNPTIAKLGNVLPIAVGVLNL